MAEEALNSFTSLLENVPGWIADLESILEAAKGRQQELTLANKPTSPTVAFPRKAVQSPSRKSTQPDEVTGSSAQSATALKHLTNSDALRISQLKRKTASVASDDQSSRCKSRVTASAVVYYDGETQKQFEQLVRAIGTSRNAIRKGKMSAKVDALSRSDSVSSSSSCSSSSGGEDVDINKFAPPSKYRTRRSRPAFGRNDGSEAFDRVDGRLEKAQTLCERAAHRVLRDGSCTLEVTNAKEHFLEAMKMATAELPAMRKRAEKSAERRRRSAEQHRLEEAAQAALRSPRPEDIHDEKMADIITKIEVPSDGDIEVDVLEVDDDDSDSDSEEFNINSFQFTKAGGRFAPPMRTSPRLAVL